MKYGISNKKGNKSVYCTAPKTLYVYEEKLRKEFNGDFTILIPNCMDGYSVLPLLRKNHYVDCYEMNNILIDGGYIYLFYYIVDEEKDYDKFLSNSYLRTYEMKSFFDRDNWEIIYSVENHIREYSPNIYNNKIHSHRTGTLFAKKKYSRRKLKYKYTYNLY